MNTSCSSKEANSAVSLYIMKVSTLKLRVMAGECDDADIGFNTERSYAMSELTRGQLLLAVISGRGPGYLRGVDLSSLDLSNAGWLVEADLRFSNLSHANLTRANLQDARLARANLTGADLSGSNLERADLERARLNGTSLKAANIRSANLQGASLIGANLTRANLREANLEGVDLEEANLAGADLTRARLNMANLRAANLKGANLQGASLLGTTLENDNSSPSIPLPPQGYAGIVNCIQLTDLIQLLCLSKASLAIRIKSPQGQGTIYVRAGRVRHAETGAIKGEEAFFEMLRWENGQFEMLPVPEEDVISVEKPLEHLIIESMRQLDESKSARKKDYHALLQEVKQHLPIPAYPSQELTELIHKEGKELSRDQEVMISDAFDSGESGGIFCSITADNDIFIAPLDYIRVKENHPLSDKISVYQDAKA